MPLPPPHLLAGDSSCPNGAVARPQTKRRNQPISREEKRLAAAAAEEEEEGGGAGEGSADDTLWLTEGDIRALAAPLCEEDLSHRGDEIVLGGQAGRQEAAPN